MEKTLENFQKLCISHYDKDGNKIGWTDPFGGLHWNYSRLANIIIPIEPLSQSTTAFGIKYVSKC